MKFVKGIWILMLLGVVLVQSCQDSEEGSPGLLLQFDVNRDVVSYRGPGDLQFTEGFITIRAVEFSGDKANGESVSLSHEQVIVYDFATGTSDPAEDVIDIPAGTYNDIYLGIELQDVNDDPTLVIQGTYHKVADGQVYPLRFEFNSGEVFEAEAASGEVPPNTPATARITFDPHAWFTMVTFDMLENASVNNEGVIVISESSNESIFDLVADGLDLSTEAVFQ